MSLNPNDPYYRTEIVPATITAMAAPLRAAYGQPADAFGTKGNTAHTSGYHRSRDWCLHSPDSRYGAADYSVRQPADLQGDGRWVSAFDFTPGVWGSAENRHRMVAITMRVHAAARARDPRLADLREFAGTEDGQTVVTFNCADGSAKSPFDSSHLDHCHGSLWRGRADRDHSSIVAVMLGEGEDMTPEQDARLTFVFNALQRLDGGNAIGEIYLRISGGEPTGPDNKKLPYNLRSILAATMRPAIDPAALAAALAPLLQVPAADVLAVLTSSAGQEALIRAANAAEDS